MRGRHAVACVAGLAIAFASVADNAASCGEDTPTDVPGACAEMPCHTPLLPSSTALPAIVHAPRYVLAVSVIEPTSADAPAPPTPPPTARA